jgi:acyl carrier protein
METTATPSVTDMVRNVVAITLGLDISEVSATASFRDLGADSLEDVQIVIELEDAFGISVTD